MQGSSLSVLPDDELHIPVMCTARCYGFQVSLGRICSDDGMFSGGYRDIVNNYGRDGVDLQPVGDQWIKIQGIRIAFMVEGVYKILKDFPGKDIVECHIDIRFSWLMVLVEQGDLG